MKPEIQHPFSEDPELELSEAGLEVSQPGIPDIELEGMSVELSDEEIEEKLGKFVEKELPSSLGMGGTEVVEASSKLVSLHELWQRAKDRIVDITPNFVINEDKVVDAFLYLANSSISLSKVAGRFYNFLAKHGHTKSDKEHVFQETRSSLEKGRELTLEQISIVRAQHSRKSQALKAEHAIFREGLIDKFIERPIVRSVQHEGDCTIETLMQVASQVGEQNTVEEVVANLLKDEASYCSAGLFVHNKKTGISLELKQLLPAGFTFVPAEMQKIEQNYVFEDDSDNPALRLETTVVPLTLESYDGTQATEGGFSAYPVLEKVAYGDLTQKGGLLSLLHEIAHAWQSKYHSSEGRENWENFYKNTAALLNMLRDSEHGKDNAENESPYCGFLKRKLADIGVSIDGDYMYTDQELGGDKFKISSPKIVKKDRDYGVEIRHYYIQSDKVKPLIEDYVREERDAWAHALRVLRFLRKRGFDLEPELKSVKDIENIVDRCLSTYQISIDTQVKPTQDVRKFTRKSHSYIKEEEEVVNMLKKI